MDGHISLVCEDTTTPDRPRSWAHWTDYEQAQRIEKGVERRQMWMDFLEKGVCSRRLGRNRLLIGRVRNA